MRMKLDFYHWSYQCPLNREIKNLLSKYEDCVDIEIHNVSHSPDLVKELRMYFPTLTIVNDELRYFAPLTDKFMSKLCEGELPEVRPYRPNLGTEIFAGDIIELTPDNYHLAEQCTGHHNSQNCDSKQSFLRQLGLEVCGFLNMAEDGSLLGGVEYLPSLNVPYDIPKDIRTAFITCVYRGNKNYDYKSAPLQKLEEHLSKTYDRVVVVSDEEGVFPNGDLDFFLRNGYEDEGIISEEAGYCKLHLLSKNLR